PPLPTSTLCPYTTLFRSDARTWAECERIGTLLADEALRIIQDAPEQASPKLVCRSRPLTLPLESPLMRALFKQLPGSPGGDTKRSEEHTSELQSPDHLVC